MKRRMAAKILFIASAPFLFYANFLFAERITISSPNVQGDATELRARGLAIGSGYDPVYGRWDYRTVNVADGNIIIGSSLDIGTANPMYPAAFTLVGGYDTSIDYSVSLISANQTAPVGVELQNRVQNTRGAIGLANANTNWGSDVKQGDIAFTCSTGDILFYTAAADGSNAKVRVLIDHSTGEVVIGDNPSPTGKYAFTVSDATSGGYGEDVTTTMWDDYSVTSDIRLKKDIQPIPGACDIIAKLRGVSFRWRNEKASGARHYGVIAQEVEKVLPEIVKQGNDGIKSIGYHELTPIMIEAMKEDQANIDALKKDIAELKNSKQPR